MALFYPEVCGDEVPEGDVCEPDDGLRGGTVDFYAEGKKTCAGCPVRLDCLSHAVEEKERYGLWGGLSPLERRRIDRRQRRQRLKEKRSMA
jgi:hypothetical protein